VDSRAHSEHVQVFRCDINPGLVERSRDVEDVTITEKSKGITHPKDIFLDTAIFYWQWTLYLKHSLQVTKVCDTC
jgi:hypothetical protein